MDKFNIPRRNQSLVNYVVNKDKPQFEIKKHLSLFEDKLKIAGIMLYWAEGTLWGNSVYFANSNPEMVKVFLKFLREVCGVKENRLRVYLYAYDYQNVNALKLYWHRITKIPLGQFIKPYIRKDKISLSQRKLPYGLIQVRYNDKRLQEQIKSWIDEFIGWAGTQVAKGGRLCKSSVLLKGRMEK
ncbi:hypothetical protein D4Q80_03005 [bacterium]|nr:MAG: hypothetical protein D4Q80_03005 [bacterium]